MLPFIKLIKFTVNKNKITAILKQFYEEVTFMWKNKSLSIKTSAFNSFRSFMWKKVKEMKSGSQCFKNLHSQSLH